MSGELLSLWEKIDKLSDIMNRSIQAMLVVHEQLEDIKTLLKDTELNNTTFNMPQTNVHDNTTLQSKSEISNDVDKTSKVNHNMDWRIPNSNITTNNPFEQNIKKPSYGLSYTKHKHRTYLNNNDELDEQPNIIDNNDGWVTVINKKKHR